MKPSDQYAVFDDSITIEVQSSKNLHPADFKGLRVLCEEKCHSRFVILCRARMKQVGNGMEVGTVTEFVVALVRGEFDETFSRFPQAVLATPLGL